MKQALEEILAGVHKGLHGPGKVLGIGGIDSGEIPVIGVLPFLEGGAKVLPTSGATRPGLTKCW